MNIDFILFPKIKGQQKQKIFQNHLILIPIYKKQITPNGPKLEFNKSMVQLDLEIYNKLQSAQSTINISKTNKEENFFNEDQTKNLNSLNQNEEDLDLNLLNSYSIINQSIIQESGEVAAQKIKQYQFVSKQKELPDVVYEIPCLYFKNKSENILIFFHGNGEDIGMASELGIFINKRCGINVLLVEYPQYGVYEKLNSKVLISEQQIFQDAENVYRYVQQKLNYKEKNIYVFGRSIGSGPACFLAEKFKPQGLILVSPFSSIQDLAKDFVWFFGNLIQQNFNNVERMKNIKCNRLIIHGKQDTLINHKHAVQLCEVNQDLTTLLLVDEMTHSSFGFNKDLCMPLIDFIEENEE